MSKPIYVLSGPNLNMLGKREPEIYGSQTLEDIHNSLKEKATLRQIDVNCFQSNHEGQLVDLIQEAGEKASGLIINAGALTHTSVALADAIRAIDIPAIEVHMSNVYQREDFRHHSYLSPVVIGLICGFGSQSYELALDVLLRDEKK
ncbi:MAG: type II 3-dehydroquinate dehydratase [Rhizobiales bacterium]|nr:type II 3-dehydroquinate dehydratase [Hyphomicrobiales bacterium]